MAIEYRNEEKKNCAETINQFQFNWIVPFGGRIAVVSIQNNHDDDIQYQFILIPVTENGDDHPGIFSLQYRKKKNNK